MKKIILTVLIISQWSAFALTRMESPGGCNSFLLHYRTDSRDTDPSAFICEKASLLSAKLSTQDVMLAANVGCTGDQHDGYVNILVVRLVGDKKNVYPLSDVVFTSKRNSDAMEECEYSLMYLSAVTDGSVFFKGECIEDAAAGTATLSTTMRVVSCQY